MKGSSENNASDLKDSNNGKKGITKCLCSLELPKDVECDFSLVLGNLDLNFSEPSVY